MTLKNVRKLAKNILTAFLREVNHKLMNDEDYAYPLSLKKQKETTLVKRYYLVKPTRSLIEENQRYLKIQNEEDTLYMAYFTIDSIIGELDFPSNEFFYYQQQQFDFPIDTSMNIEIVANKKALSMIRNKKKELKDLDDYAWENNNETGNDVLEALEYVAELEITLDQSKEAMCK